MHQTRSSFRSLTRAALAAAALAVAGAAEAGAQTFYPAFQPPRTVAREYTFAVADGDGLTALLFQWREGWSPTSQFAFEGGIADPAGDGDVSLLLGATYGRQLARATNDLPLDILLTLGGNTMIGDTFVLEVPVGVSVGHRFPLDQGLAITPYVHPRLALQYVSVDDESDTDLGVAFDIGVDFEVSSRLSIRGALTFGDDDGDAIGIGLSWRPMGLRR